jgi:hypothetical protein
VERETRPGPTSHDIKPHFTQLGGYKKMYEGKCVFGNSYEKYLNVSDFGRERRLLLNSGRDAPPSTRYQVEHVNKVTNP